MYNVIKVDVFYIGTNHTGVIGFNLKIGNARPTNSHTVTQKGSDTASDPKGQ